MALTRVTSGGIAPGVVIKFDQNNTPTAPAIGFEGSGNTGTGIYSPADNTISIATNEKSRLTIDGDGKLILGTSTDPVYLPVTDSQSADTTNLILYVNKNHSNADDSFTNDGENLNRPFKSIERALVEVSRKSYVPGTGITETQAGADKFEFATVIIYPGEYEVDNRPGVYEGSVNNTDPTFSYPGPYTSTFNIVDGDISSDQLYKFNSIDGGVIVPRGTSLVGLDLRKTVIRPKYIPDAAAATNESAIFSLTGGTYIWQLTFKDAKGTPYVDQTNQYTDANRSHHKLVAFNFTTDEELGGYYFKVNQIITSIPAYTGVTTDTEFHQRLEENRIVGNTTQLTIDTVSSSSPYVFNCSLRSTWGMCGLHADGDRASGFKSMVIAQFTGVSLQKDDRAFYLGGGTTSDIDATPDRHNNVNSVYVDAWRHYHIKSSNSSFIQVVSVFAVGYADHFIAESGGDLSITNSNSNFGNKSLVAKGFQSTTFDQNDKGFITAVIPPRGLDSSDISDVSLSFINTIQTIGADTQTSNSPNNNAKVLYIGEKVKRSKIREIYINEGGNAKRYLVVGTNNEYTLHKKSDERLYLEIDDVIYEEDLRTTVDSTDPSNGNHDNSERVGYGWHPANPSETVTDETEGYVYLKLTYASTETSFSPGDNGILKKVFQTTTIGEVPSTVESFDYYFSIPNQPYIKRLEDNRVNIDKNNLLWRLEYKIDKGVSGAKPPEKRYVIYPRTGTTTSVLWIYDIEVKQPYIYGPTDGQDGIYYLTVIKGDIGDFEESVNGNSSSPLKVNQNINYLYPTVNLDTPNWNPDASVSKILVDTSSYDDYRSLEVSIIDPTTPGDTPNFYSITREAVDTFISFSSVNLGAGFTNTGSPYADQNDNTYGKDADVNGRLISTDSPYGVSLRRPSIIRASGHTWEYLGYGPGNYSTSFPSLQTINLNIIEKINSQTLESEGGYIASSGINSDGEYFIGNQIIKLGSDNTKSINSPKVTYTTETRLTDYTDDVNNYTNSLTNVVLPGSGAIPELQSNIQSQLSQLSSSFTTESLTVNTSLVSNSDASFKKLKIDNTNINNDDSLGFPVADSSAYGFAKRTNDSSNIMDSSGYITPGDLESWRISRGIESSSSSVTGQNIIYMQPYRATQLTGGALSSGATTVPVQSTDGFTRGGYIEIEYRDDDGNVTSEIIQYTGLTDTSFIGCTRGQKGTTAVEHVAESTVTLYQRWDWEEPFIAEGESEVSYNNPARVEAWVRTDDNTIDEYVKNYTPNPEIAKSYGADIKSGKAKRSFKPFSTFKDASDWARKVGLGTDDEIILRMQPGYYKIDDCDFPRKVIINGATIKDGSTYVDGQIGNYKGNDYQDNNSVFLWRDFKVSKNGNNIDIEDIGTFNAKNGLDISYVHILSRDELIGRTGIKTSDFDGGTTFKNARKDMRADSIGNVSTHRGSRFTTLVRNIKAKLDETHSVNHGSGSYFSSKCFNIEKYFNISNVTIGAQEESDFIKLAYQYFRGGFFNVKDASMNIGSIRLRGNERWFWPDVFGVETKKVTSNVIPSEKTVTSTATSGQADVVLDDVEGLNVGDVVYGNVAIVNGTTINSITGTTVTLSNNLAAGIAASTTLTFVQPIAVSDTTDIIVGDRVGGVYGIPNGTTVSSIDTVNNKITLSNNLTGEVKSGRYIAFNRRKTVSSGAASGQADIVLSDVSNISVGYYAVHDSIPVGTTIDSITGTTVTLSNNLVANIAVNDKIDFLDDSVNDIARSTQILGHTSILFSLDGRIDLSLKKTGKNLVSNVIGRTSGTFGAVAATGGSGNGAEFSVTVGTGATPASVVLTSAGTGYTDDDTLTLSATGLWGVGDITVDVNGVDVNGAIQGIDGETGLTYIKYTGYNYFNSDNLIYLEPTFTNGSILEYDSRTHRTTLSTALSTTDTTITGPTEVLKNWPYGGIGQINASEWFTYVNKTDNGDGTTTLNNVSRNIGGNLSSPLAFNSGAPLWLSDYYDPSSYNTTDKKWEVSSSTAWHSQGPILTYVFAAINNIELTFNDNNVNTTTNPADLPGVVGQFGNTTNLTVKSLAVESSLDINKTRQSYTGKSIWSIAAPIGHYQVYAPDSAVLNLSNVTLSANITDSDTTVVLESANESDLKVYQGESFKIGDEILHVSVSNTSALPNIVYDQPNSKYTLTLTNVVRGYNRTIPTAHTAGDTVTPVDGSYISAGRTRLYWDKLNLSTTKFGYGTDLHTNITNPNKENEVGRIVSM